MAKAYVSEYTRLVRLNVDVPQIADESSLVAEYVVDFTAGVANGAAFNNATTYIRVELDGIASIKIGPAAVATTLMKRKSANNPEYFALGLGVGQGWRISAITNT